MRRKLSDRRSLPSSDELIELDFEMAPPAAIDDDECSSLTIDPAPVEARTITQLERGERTGVLSPNSWQR